MPNDIFFVSYGEKNAEKNWRHLISRFDYTCRVKGVKGIEQAYKRAASQAQTDFFYIVDADNEILSTFNFDFKPQNDEVGTYIWKAINPVNDLVYGYGGIKLYSKEHFGRIDFNNQDEFNPISFMSKFDFPICDRIKFIDEVASITRFDTSEFNSWKAAFRECCKLISFGKYLGLNDDKLKNDYKRLNVWLTVGLDRPFGNWVIRGAHDGKEYGTDYINDITGLAKINDFDWLKDRFNKKYTNVFD